MIPTGTLALKSHPLFNVHPEHQYSMFVVNPMGVIYRPLGTATLSYRDISRLMPTTSRISG